MKALDAAMAALMLAAMCAAAHAGEDRRLKEGPGRDVVLGNCSTCHSTDYIQMNSPFMKRAAWEATVNKMIKVMGATIRPEDVPVIVDYLTRNYGVE